MSRESLILSWIVVLIIGLTAAIKDECYTNADCFNDFRHLRIVCCKNSRDSDRICQPYNCEGRYCSTDGDCGGEGECCINNKCINSQDCPRCNSSSDCATSEYCCKRAQGNVCRRSCVGERCDSFGECAGPDEYCDSDATCAKLTKTSIQITRQIPKQFSPRPNTPTRKSNSPATTDSFPGWAIGFILCGILFAVIGAILLHDRCKTRPGTQTFVERNNEETEQVENTARQTSRLPAPLPETLHPAQTALRPPPPIPSYNGEDTETHTYEYARDLPSRTPTLRRPPSPPSYDGQNISQTVASRPSGYDSGRFINMPPGQ